MFRKRRGEPAPPPPRGPRGKRCYAIGDVHGRLDLLDALLSRLAEDAASRARRETSVVLLGDLIDRGPDSRGVVERLAHGSLGFAALYHLQGNHEEMLLRILAGEHDLVPDWLSHGGVATAASYGLPASVTAGATAEQVQHMLRSVVPSTHREWLAGGLDSVRFGDYYLVHAGVRSGVPLDAQSPRDLRWIRRGFLDSDADLGAVVVHGHSVSEEVVRRPNRIGIDTGAYRTGRLTALRLEDEDAAVLSVTGRER